jgi:hypothetical protein
MYVNMKNIKLYEYYLLFSKYYSALLMYIFTRLSCSRNYDYVIPDFNDGTLRKCCKYSEEPVASIFMIRE